MDTKGKVIIVSALTLGSAAIGFELGKMYVVNKRYDYIQTKIKRDEIHAMAERWKEEHARVFGTEEETSS